MNSRATPFGVALVVLVVMLLFASYAPTPLVERSGTGAPATSAVVPAPPARFPSSRPTTGNLLENPGFEDGLAGWNQSQGTAVYSADNTTSHTGCCSVKGVASNTGSPGRLYEAVTNLTTPGYQYQVSGWVRSSGVTGQAVFGVDYVSTGGGTAADGYVGEAGYVQGTTDWSFYQSSVFTLPSMPGDATGLWFLLGFSNGAGTAWWDDLSLVCISCAPTATVGLNLLGNNSYVSPQGVVDGYFNTMNRSFPVLLTGNSTSSFWPLQHSVMLMAPSLPAGGHDTGLMMFPSQAATTLTIHEVGVFSPSLLGDGLSAYFMMTPVRATNWSTPYYATNPEGPNGTFLPCQGSLIFPYSTTPYFVVQWDPAYILGGCGNGGSSDFNLYLVVPQAGGQVTPSDILSAGPIGSGSGILPAPDDSLRLTGTYDLATDSLNVGVTDKDNAAVSYVVAENLSDYGFSPTYEPSSRYFFGAGGSGNTPTGWGLLYLSLGEYEYGTYPESFIESGLPPGAPWSVTLQAYTKTSTSNSIVFYDSNGTYPFNVSQVPGYDITPIRGVVTVAGAPVSTSISFRPNASRTFPVEFNESGLSHGTEWTVTLSGTTQSSLVGSMVFLVANGTYSFSIGEVAGYSRSPASGSLTVDGAQVTITIQFSPLAPPTYVVTFGETGLPPGTNWSVTLGGMLQSSDSDTVAFDVSNGTLGYTVISAGWQASPSRGNVTVEGAPLSVPIAFTSVPIPYPTVPAGIVAFVPVVIQNFQPIATPRPYQQSVPVDSARFATDEAANLSNIEFFNSNGSLVPSWLESGNRSTATDTLYWLNLSEGIAANSSVIVYLGFAAPSTNLFNAQVTGEAPQLSATSDPYGLGSTGYAKYDDGRAVFPLYQNFVNVDLNQSPGVDNGIPPPGWYTGPSISGCNYGFNGVNGWEADGVNGCGVVYSGSDFPVTPARAVDIDVNYLQTVAPDWQAPFVISSSPSSFEATDHFALEWADGSSACNTYGAAASFDAVSGPGGATIASLGVRTAPFVLTLTPGSVQENYTSIYSPGSLLYTTSGYLAMATQTSSYCGSTVRGWWVDERALPPNGAMPSVSLGSIMAVSSPSISSLLVTPISAVLAAGATQTLTAAAISANGTLLEQGVTYSWSFSPSSLGILNRTLGQTVTFTAGTVPENGTIYVNATRNGETRGGTVAVAVSGPSAPSSLRTSSTSPLPLYDIGLVAVVVVAAVAIVAVFRRSRRQRKPPG